MSGNMLEIKTHPWTRFTLPPESCHVFRNGWFLISPGRIVWSPVRRMGFSSWLVGSPRRLWVWTVEVLSPPLKGQLLWSWRRLNHRVSWVLRCNLGCNPKRRL